jgi:uncharacterized protein (TIGR02996 family)
VARAKGKRSRQGAEAPAPSLDEVLLRDVLEHPGDDTPRLVYADWLEEHGDEGGKVRAELIRVQCELERLPAGDSRRGALARRSRTLLAAHAKRWSRPLAQAGLGTKFVFRRGFVGEVTMSATAFVRNATELFALAPVQFAHFPDASNEVNGLAGSPHLARLTGVDLRRMCVCGGCPIERELRKLFRSPHAANLTELILAEDRIDDAGAAALAASPTLRRLGTLDLSGNRIGPAGVRALAGATWLANLRGLDLSGNPIGAAGAEALAASPHLDKLEVLTLGAGDVPPEGRRALRGKFGRRLRLRRAA